jgi:subtilase family serine protease
MTRLQILAAPLLAAVSVATLSHAAAPANARVTAAAPSATVDFEVFLPLRNKDALASLLTAQQTPGSASYHKWLTPAQFGAQFGPSAISLANVENAAKAAGLQVTEIHTRSIHVTGPVAKVNNFLQTTLNVVTVPGSPGHLQAAAPVKLPSALAAEHAIIAAFTAVPPRHEHMQRSAGAIDPNNRNGPWGYYWADDMKQAYNYPSYKSVVPGKGKLDGHGVHVAVLMETSALNSDLDNYFNHEHWTQTTGRPVPHIAVHNVDGGAPFDINSGGSFEASLDVQQVLGGAPGAAVTLVSIPDLFDSHILDGYVKIVDLNTWDIVNSSFGGCELNYTPAYNEGVDETGVLQVYHEVFEQGNAQGITFVASSGDSGGKSCPSVNYFFGAKDATFVASVETPADDPNVTSVGGGNLETTPPPNPQTNPPTLTSKYVSENADGDREIPYDIYGFGATVSGGWWGAGGGRSVIFGMPTYQNWTSFFGNPGTGRIVPDIGMQVGGCPGGISLPTCDFTVKSFVVTAVGGGFYGLIGTSVASPEFVGALALYEQTVSGRLGNINAFLWAKGFAQTDLGGPGAAAPGQFFHQGLHGYDGVYQHTDTVGFDYMYGNGSPNVRTLFGLNNYAPAGDPQTPSNP